MKASLRIRAYYPNYFADAAIALAALRIVGHFNDGCVQADLMGFSSDSTLRRYKKREGFDKAITGFDGRLSRPIYRDAIPSGLAWSILRRAFSPRRIASFSEWRFLSTLRKGDVAYLWPDASLELHRRAKARGCILVSERINTLLCNSMRILDAEFGALGISAEHGLTRRAAAEELECMSCSDFIFSPSPGVTDSILEAGIPKEKIIEASYGLDEREILEARARPPAGRKITALFAGRICVRKGVHLLLKAWERAGVDARLVIVGRIAPEIDRFFRSSIRGKRDIEYLEHVRDLEPLYRDADFFILPSIEEGSPLVSYLALGASLPLLVSPMGAGGIVADRQEGLIIDPHDEEAFAAAIRTMVLDGATRGAMAAAAGAKASSYTWGRVAARRRESLLARMADLPSIR